MRFQSENPIFESDNLKQQIKMKGQRKREKNLRLAPLIIFLFSYMRYLIVLGAKLHTLKLRPRLSKKNESNFQKKFFHSDYQIFISLIKTHKNGPQKSLRAKLCDLRVKTLYLRATT